MAPEAIVTDDACLQFMSPRKTQSGFAFEVQIKSPGSGEAKAPKSPVRLRLEERLEFNTPSPKKTLFRGGEETVKERAQKVREKNEQKRLATERAEAESVQKQQQLSTEVAAKAERAAQKREEALRQRRSHAAKHFEEVKAKKEFCQLRRADDVDALQQRLSGLALQTEALHAACLAKRGAFAGQHNNKVAGKVFEHQVKQQHGDSDGNEDFFNAVTTQTGFSFEVPIKRARDAAKPPAVSQRFQERASTESPPASPTKANSSPAKLARTDAAERAHEQNEKAKAKAEEAKAKATERTQKLSDLMASKAERATKKREEALARRRRRAARHFVEVQAKKGSCQQRVAEHSEDLLRRLGKILRQKDALYVAGLARRRAQARQHNDKVAGKAFEHQVKLQESNDGVDTFANPVETASGFSFEVPIKLAGKFPKDILRSHRQREENLRSSRKVCSTKATLRSMAISECAKKQNELKRQAMERAQKETSERKQHLQEEAAAKAERAAKKQEEILTRRGAEACKHLKMVEARRDGCRKQSADSVAARQKWLSERAILTETRLDSILDNRRAYAGQHNKVVAGRVLKHQLKRQGKSDAVAAQPMEISEGFAFEPASRKP